MEFFNDGWMEFEREEYTIFGLVEPPYRRSSLMNF